MVGVIANEWFIPVIAMICILGVISAAVTSGDTALRSARLIVADFLHFDQKPIKNRLLVAIPIFVITTGILVYSIADKDGFGLIWRYFAWANQVLATVTLWAITIYLAKNKAKMWHLITLLPALFMTMVTGCFLFVAEKGGFGSMLPKILVGNHGVFGQKQGQALVSDHPHPRPVHDHGDGLLPLCGQSRRRWIRICVATARGLRHWCRHHIDWIDLVLDLEKET